MFLFRLFFLFLFLHSTVGVTDYYHKYWCGHGLQYLDDSKCIKKFPSVYNRDWICPNPISSTIPEGFVKDNELSTMKIDTSSLLNYISNDLLSYVNVRAVVSKRVKDDTAEKGFSLYHRYFCAGDKSMTEGYETWSR